jgi:hypothetical protein
LQDARIIEGQTIGIFIINKNITKHKGSKIVAARETDHSDDLKVVTRHQTSTAPSSGNLGFPPAVVLKPNDRQDVSFGKSELFGYGGGIAIQSACKM